MRIHKRVKRSELPLFLSGAVLLLAAAAYTLLFFTARAEEAPTAVCSAAVWQDTLSLCGTVRREETPVAVPEGRVYPLVPSGRRVAAGEPVALVCGDGEAYFRAALLLRVRSELSSGADAVSEDAAVHALSLSLARREFSAFGTVLPAVRRSLGYTATNGNALRREEESLVLTGAEESIVRAPCAGFFSLAAESGTGGIASGGWSFTAPLDAAAAARLPDGTAELLLPDGTHVTAEVRRSDEGTSAVFSCDTHLDSVFSLGECTLTVLLAEWQGFSLPSAALAQGAESEIVCRVSGSVREYVPVTVLARRGENVLVSSPQLRSGMTVLLFPAEDAASS